MKKWYQFALFNLVVLALLGLILRYKINFALPFVLQKNLLHAHSHFAFYGWVSFLLQLLFLDTFTGSKEITATFRNRFFVASSVLNYGMIYSFAVGGYSTFSIVLSTAALLLSYVFVYKAYTTLPLIDKHLVSTKFAKASLVFLGLSSIGPFVLAYVLTHKTLHPYWAHNALYFFLHFQYNGWFTFAVMALLFKKLESSPLYNSIQAKAFFRLLLVTCIPAYFTTMLLTKMPLPILFISLVTAVVQGLSLVYLYRLLTKNYRVLYAGLPAVCRWLYAFAISAFVLKVVLQFFSAHPQVGHLAFAYRSIIIGYLHLVFLVFISLYLLAHLAEHNFIPASTRLGKSGLLLFSLAVIANELLLAVQGFTAIYSLYVPAVDLLLFANTLLILAGAVLLFISAMQGKVKSKK